MSTGNYNTVQDPFWSGHLVRKVDLGTFDDDAESNLYERPLRYLRAYADGDVTFTLHGNDTAESDHKITITMTEGQELAVFAIRKIWATGTTILAADLLGAQ